MGVSAAIVAATSVVGTVVSMDAGRRASNTAADKAKQDAATLNAQLGGSQPAMSTQATFDSANKLSIIEQMQRRGRASTMLTPDTASPLGGAN